MTTNEFVISWSNRVGEIFTHRPLQEDPTIFPEYRCTDVDFSICCREAGRFLVVNVVYSTYDNPPNCMWGASHLPYEVKWNDGVVLPKEVLINV